jgi:hypothetical protein
VNARSVAPTARSGCATEQFSLPRTV